MMIKFSLFDESDFDLLDSADLKEASPYFVYSR